MEPQNIIIFDGVCNFCNGAVNFIIQRDKNRSFMFTPMQSDTGKHLIEKYQVDLVGKNTFLLIKNGTTFIKTEAALEICKELSGGWKYFRLFKYLPLPVRDRLYTLLATHRYRLFGKRDSCMVPTPEIRERFIQNKKEDI